jgi:hypothetical protein
LAGGEIVRPTNHEPAACARLESLPA